MKDVKQLLKTNRAKISLALRTCAHCSLCAESCFLYRTKGRKSDLVPSHKLINSIGTLHREKGEVTPETLAAIRETAFEKCALCMRCYCPLGVSLPHLISLARQICRIKGIS